MAVNGFPIKAIGGGDFETTDPWLNTAEATYDAVFDVESEAQFNVNTTRNFEVGQTVTTTGTYATTGTITKVTNDQTGKKIQTDITFTTTGTGSIFVDGSVEWDDETPEEFLRQIHVEINVFGSNAIAVEVSFDDEGTWQFINNGATVLGLQTFTMFVQKDTLLNFRGIFTNGGAMRTVTIVVTTL